MARSRIKPTYRLHKKTGKAIVTVYAQDGRRQSMLLPGRFESQQSKREYAKLIERLTLNDGRLPTPEPKKVQDPELTIDQLILKFMNAQVVPYYINPVTKQPTGEQENFRCAMKPLSKLFGEDTAATFGPQNLVDVQQAMINGSHLEGEERGKYKPLARGTINTRIGRIKMMFRWAAKMQLIPPSVHHGLMAVDGLKPGRSAARETDDITPVPVAMVHQTMEDLPPVVRDIVEFLLVTGMRVGEAVIMRAIDLDMTGPVWLYRPIHHKTLWRGHARVIAIGPRGQEIIKKYLKMKMDAYLFSPAEQHAMIMAQKREARKSKVQPSQLSRRKARPRKKPGEQFTPGDINQAIRRACNRAGLEPWHTHQLRHTAALEAKRQHGLEAARAMLGHKSIDMAAHYAGQDLDLAQQVAAKIG